MAADYTELHVMTVKKVQMWSLQKETTLRVYGCLACVTNVFR